MAIQVNLTAEQTNIGADVTGAYARIVAMHWDAKTGKATIAVDVWWNRAARDMLTKAPIFGGVYNAKFYSSEINSDFTRGLPVDPAVDALPTLGGLAQNHLYTFIKTVPDFSSGVDV